MSLCRRAIVNEMCVAGGTFGGERNGGAGAASGAGPATHAALPGAFVCRAVKVP